MTLGTVQPSTGTRDKAAPPHEMRHMAEATRLMLVMIMVVLAILLVGWLALTVLRRRWVGSALASRPGSDARRRVKPSDPWQEAGRRIATTGDGGDPPGRGNGDAGDGDGDGGGDGGRGDDGGDFPLAPGSRSGGGRA